MTFAKMTMAELLAERKKLVNQRLIRLRGSNPYKRLTHKIAQVDKCISIIRQQQKHDDKLALRTNLDSMSQS